MHHRIAAALVFFLAACSSPNAHVAAGTTSGGTGGMAPVLCFVNADCPSSLGDACHTVHCDPTGKDTAPGSPVLGCYLLNACDAGPMCSAPTCPPGLIDACPNVMKTYCCADTLTGFTPVCAVDGGLLTTDCPPGCAAPCAVSDAGVMCDVSLDCSVAVPCPTGPCLLNVCTNGKCVNGAEADGSPCMSGGSCTNGKCE